MALKIAWGTGRQLRTGTTMNNIMSERMMISIPPCLQTSHLAIEQHKLDSRGYLVLSRQNPVSVHVLLPSCSFPIRE
jgi:hypothetical protein